jgi:hypothetical protein
MRKLPLAALALAALAWAAPAGGAGAYSCDVEGSKTVRSSDKVRVYSKGSNLYGCVRRTGVTRTLYEYHRPLPNEGNHLDRVRLAGYHVAYVLSRICTVCGDGGPFASIHEYELRSGRHRSLSPVRRRPDHTGTGVNALVLDRCGRIAYRAILRGTFAQPDPDPELHVWVGDARRRVDRGAIHLIELAPAAVEWVRDGEPRSAPLAPACGA